MATAFASIEQADNGGATTVVLAKPSGLTAGDLMIAIIGQTNSNSLFSLTDWTSLGSSVAGTHSLTVLWKIATAGDAAASDFTFTSATNAVALGVLMRITGTSFTGAGNLAIDIDLESPGTQNPTFTSSLAPVGDNSLLILGIYSDENGGDVRTVSGYEVANTNPSWTERAEVQNGGSDITLAVATASFTPSTTPGNYSVDLSGSPTSSEAYGFLISVKETTSVSNSPSAISAVLSTIAPAVAAGASATVSAALSLVSSVTSAVVSFPASKFTNVDKSTVAGFTNEPKS